jgi:hypothetical protein
MRIREAQKHMDPTDPNADPGGPKHIYGSECGSGSLTLVVSCLHSTSCRCPLVSDLIFSAVIKDFNFLTL